MKRSLHSFIVAYFIISSLTEMKAQDNIHTSFIPEISLVGNNEEIPDGDSIASLKNNTHFGNVGITQTKIREFFIRNSGPAGLVVTDINFTGDNADEFSLAEIPAYPITIDPNKDFAIHVIFTPKKGGTRWATINIINNDIDEGVYNVHLEGEATFTTAIECPGLLTGLKIYPNPANDMATVEIASEEQQTIAIRVFNLQGQEVRLASIVTLSIGNQQLVLNTADLHNGVYYLTLNSSKGEEKMKIAVMHE